MRMRACDGGLRRCIAPVQAPMWAAGVLGATFWPDASQCLESFPLCFLGLGLPLLLARSSRDAGVETFPVMVYCVSQITNGQ